MTRWAAVPRLDPSAVARMLPWLLLGLVALSLASPFRVAAAGDCSVTIDGQSLAAAADPASALTIDAEGNPEVVATSAEPVSKIDITVSVWPFSWTETRTPAAPTTEWVGTLPVTDFTRFGAGVYQVTVATETCSISG